MKKKLLLPAIASLIFLFSTPGCKKDPVAPAPGGGGGGATPPNLTIETVRGPKKEDCGGFDWFVKFILKGASAKGGWIVQKITRDPAIFSCPGILLDGPSLTYWEAWHIMPASKDDSSRAAGLFDFDDEFREPDHPDTRGSVSFNGEVKFFEGLDLPAGFIRSNPGTYAGGLPSTTVKPAFWDADGTAPHTLSSIWDCCVNPHTQSLVTVPGDGSVITPVIKVDTSKLDYVDKMIMNIPAWTYGYYTTESQLLVNIARQVQQITTPSGLRSSILKYQNAFAGTSDYIDQMSKVYLLLRVLYQLPQSINRSNAHEFGGWMHPGIANTSLAFNPAWPVSVTQTYTQVQASVANFAGFVGRTYDAAAEFDYFNSNFQRRNL